MIVVRHSYISTRNQRSKSPKVVAIGKALAHVKYIQHRPGPDREEGGRNFFNESEDHADAREMRQAIRELGGNGVVVHKITLAPEISPEDKRAFTREVMEGLGNEKGLDLRWWAVEHNNTAHHHVHVVILGKDKSGREVRLEKRDYNRIKEYGDRHLERLYPEEMERAKVERERKEQDRLEAHKQKREAQRQERIKEGLELPWMHRKIVREQIEPYEKWKEAQQERSAANADKGIIEAAGRKWSSANTLAELDELNKYLWDNYDERLGKAEYKQLIGWIKDKERHLEQGETKKDPDSFEYKGQKYSKDSSYEQLTTLDGSLRAKKKDRLPIEDYQRLKGWIENCDRERWSGAIAKQLELSKQQHTREEKANNSPAAGRAVNPLQNEIVNNPIFGLFMLEASIAAEIVKSIPLTEKSDVLKENTEELEGAKRDKEAEQRSRGTPEEKSLDEETINKIDKALEENKGMRNESGKTQGERNWDLLD